MQAQMTLKDEIKIALSKKLPNAEVYLIDPDGKHLEAIVVDVTFEAMPLLERHKRVMRCLKTHFETKLHALSLHTYTPQEWEEKQDALEGALHV
jgi:acid stress-induced BolA-like protein IbaG/YrbA